MKKQVLLVLAPAVALLCAALPASGHERDTFKIGDRYYVFTVGSLNEPFVVDSISGVDLRVSRLSGPPGGAAGKGSPIAGLERTLKVELSAGDKKKRWHSILRTRRLDRIPRFLFLPCKRPTATEFSAHSRTAPWICLSVAWPERFRRRRSILRKSRFLKPSRASAKLERMPAQGPEKRWDFPSPRSLPTS